ncbi:hypothetical protein EON64_15570 [archaeon]|nr:MAG: hypothetical protein EON64_15570 [archaeon]
MRSFRTIPGPIGQLFRSASLNEDGKINEDELDESALLPQPSYLPVGPLALIFPVMSWLIRRPLVYRQRSMRASRRSSWAQTRCRKVVGQSHLYLYNAVCCMHGDRVRWR